MQVRRDEVEYGTEMKISESTPQEIHRKWHGRLLGGRVIESRTLKCFILGKWIIECTLYG